MTKMNGGPAVLAVQLSPLGTTLQTALSELLRCAAASLDPPADRELIVTGEFANWDECCAGQVWSRLASVETLTTPKLGHSPQLPCRRSWVVNAMVGVLRCATSVDNSGRLPSPAAVTADSMQVVADQAALLNAVHCCVPDLPGVLAIELDRWQSLGPDGGCLGGEWSLTLTVQTDDCPPP